MGVRRIEGISAAVILACGLFATSALCDETFSAMDKRHDTPLATVVSRAVRIARVRITERIPVGVSGPIVEPPGALTSSQRCGHLYRARVVEPLKGGGGDFEFFSAVDSDFKGFERDYLLFVYERDPKATAIAVSSLADILRVEERANLICKSHGTLFAPVQPQLFRAFDPEAEKQLGGLWLETPSRDSILWCGQGLGAKPTGLFVSRKKKSEDQYPTIVGWDGVKGLVAASMSNWYRFWERDRLLGC